MLIARADPLLAVAASAAAIAVVASHVWFLMILSRTRKLLVRILDVLSEMSVDMSRLEQDSAGGTPAREMRGLAASVSQAIRQPGVDIESILADEKP